MTEVRMNKRILIVDDEPRVLKVVRKRVELAGYRVVTAMDGLEALELARAEKPDLIVLDLMLPRKNGYEVCRELKHDPDFGGTPILMLTARTQEKDIEDGMACGADGYMLKPFDSDELLARIRGLLDKVDHEAIIRKGEMLGG